MLADREIGVPGKRGITMKPDLNHIVAAWVLVIWSFAFTAYADELDTIYLRDGSVVKGTVLRRNSGDYQVYSKFGVMNVNPEEVIHLTPRDSKPPIIEETHFFLDDTTRSLSIIEREIPEQTSGSLTFKLLMPGRVESVITDRGFEAPFESRAVGDNSLATIHFTAVGKQAKRIRVAVWQSHLLSRVDEKSVRFQCQYTPDRDGTISIILQYPKAWKIRSIAPQPASRFEGLIVWRQAAARQIDFMPEAVFEK
jgi:hypothetical protein